MSPERIDELIALAVLGELSVQEEGELDEAARMDPTVATELAEALETAATIQRTSAEDPPAGLRDGVLAAIRDSPQERIDGSAGEGASPGVVVPINSAGRRRWLPLLAGVAAAAVLIVGGIVVVSQNDSGNDDDVVAVIEAPDAVTRVLVGELGESLSVTYSVEQDAVVVEGQGVPTIGDDRTYQLWLVADGVATSAGLFRPGAGGVVLERLDGVDPTGFVLGVTEEPAGGSDSPTLPILAST